MKRVFAVSKKHIFSKELGYYSNEADSVAIVKYLRPKLRLLLTRRRFLA